jgi:hypothetical protein
MIALPVNSATLVSERVYHCPIVQLTQIVRTTSDVTKVFVYRLPVAAMMNVRVAGHV